MKKLLLLTFLSVFALSCNKKVELSGEIVSQTKQVASYNAVSNNSSANIELDSSVAANEILITGDKTLVDNLEIDNNDGQINISSKESIYYKSKSSPLIIKMNNPNLQKVVIAGAGSVATNNITLTKDVEFHISGAGEINVKLFNNITSVFITGAGDVRLRGISNEIKASMSGAGNLNSEGLTNKLANIEITGAGNAKVNTSDEINVRISGVGNLDYKNYDRLKIVKKISGVGSINPY